MFYVYIWDGTKKSTHDVNVYICHLGDLGSDLELKLISTKKRMEIQKDTPGLFVPHV
jgi:hypothetical protein